MNLLIQVQEEKADFLMELLNSLAFVSVEPLTPNHAQLIKGLKEAVDQVNLAKEGKITLKPARKLLDEL